MTDILFVGHFINSTNKVGETGLTVTIDIDRYTIADGSRTALLTAGSCTEGRDGLYSYRLAGADPTTYVYVAVLKTAATTVDQKELAALGMVIPDVKPSTLATAASVAALNDPTAAAIADAVWDEALAGHVDAGSTGKALNDVGGGEAVTAANIQAWITAALTGTSNVTVVSVVSGSAITVYANDTWSFTVTDSSLALTGYEDLAFVVKVSDRHDDDDALLIIRKVTGLVRIAKAAPTSASNGSLVAASATSFTVVVAISETATLQHFGTYTWWLKGFDTTDDPDEGYTLATGSFMIQRPGLQAVV